MTDGMGAGWADVASRWQRLLNARPIPPRRLQNTGRNPIRVTARLMWEHDGEQLVDTRAVDWVGRDVLVEVFDPRWQTQGVWLDAGDVGRR